jgi:hypothetical protein
VASCEEAPPNDADSRRIETSELQDLWEASGLSDRTDRPVKPDGSLSVFAASDAGTAWRSV